MIPKRHLAFPSLLLCAAAVCLADATAPDPVDRAIAAVKPALVRILVVTVDDEQGREVKYESSGSGVIISPQGHVVTNHHVAGKARRLMCTLASRRVLDAELVGTDPLTDIAVLKMKGLPSDTFPCAAFGNSDSLRVGQRVFAMGSPLALSQSVTEGIVSNTELVMPRLYWPFDKMTIEGEDVGLLVKWIGHDAVIFPGNSGGPLVDAWGRIAGINELDLGISAAIPGNLAREIARTLIARGTVARAWIGLEEQPLLKSMQDVQGVLVSGVIAASPADKAGIRSGDVITSVGGRAVCARFDEDLPAFNRLVSTLPVGKKTAVAILRKGKPLTLTVVPVDREYLRPRAVEFKVWGMTASNLSQMMAKEMKRRDAAGVLVTSVRPGGPVGSARPPIDGDDIITAVGGAPVRDVESLRKLTAELTSKGKDPVPVVVTFDRSDEQRITLVTLGGIDEESGVIDVRKSWLPVSIQVLTPDLAEALGLQGTPEVRITRVFSGADKAGLRVGDIITKLDGEPIETMGPEDVDVLPALIRRYKIGATARLTVIRGKETVVKEIRLAEAPRAPREFAAFRDSAFEFSVRDIGFMDRETQHWPGDRTGVLVDAVDQGSWAALGRLAVGDLIMELDGTPVEGADAFGKRMRRVSEARAPAVVFKVLRGIHTLFVELQPDWDGKK